jgi:hypothetical protein
MAHNIPGPPSSGLKWHGLRTPHFYDLDLDFENDDDFHGRRGLGLCPQCMTHHTDEQGVCHTCQTQTIRPRPVLNASDEPLLNQWGEPVTPTTCDLCGEGGADAEMYDPKAEDDSSVLCHHQCGIDRGYELA